jgi:hypothetical protein
MFLGPALCCWHDSTFKESDFKGIISLGMGSKQNDMNKCGKFGVGFNSVYHLTDCPQFISNDNDYVVFDPLCECFPDMDCLDPGFRIPNGNIKSDFFSEIHNLFKIGLDLNNATMFRLPLRSKTSQLSSSIFNKQNIEPLIDLYSNASKDILLFLRNIKKISFYKIDKNSNGLKCLSEEVIEISEAQYLEKDDFSKNLKKVYDKKYSNQELSTIPVKQISYSATVSNLVTKKKFEYILLEKVGWDANFILPNELSNLAFKMFPFASIALNIEDIFTKNSNVAYKLYNFLPLEQESPLFSHLNSHWCLHEENRTKLYEFGQKSNNINSIKAQFDKYAPEWNLVVINSLICPLYIELFNSVKEKINQRCSSNNLEFSELVLKNYFKLFPQNLNESMLNNNNSYFNQLFKDFYSKIIHVACVPIISNFNGSIEWYKPSEIYFINKLELFFKKKFTHKSKIVEILSHLGINICTDRSYLNLFKIYASIDLKQIDSQKIIEQLKANISTLHQCKIENTVFKNFENYEMVLTFCLDEDKVDLKGCPLLATNDSIIVVFSSLNKLFKFEKPDIFQNKQHLFLHEKLYIEHKKLNQFLKSISIKDLVDLLPFALNPIVYKCSNNLQNVECTDSIKIKIQKIWEIIANDINENVCPNFENISKKIVLEKLKPINSWFLIPIKFESVTNKPINNWFFIPNIFEFNQKLFLMPLSKCDLIINKNDSGKFSNFIYQIVEKINLPILNLYFDSSLSTRSHTTKLLKIIATTLDKNEDILMFLRNNSMDKVLFKDSIPEKLKDAEQFRIFLNSSIIQKHYNHGMELSFSLTNPNSFTQSEVKEIIRKLCIFTDIADRVETLFNDQLFKERKETYVLNFNDIPIEVLNALSTEKSSPLFNFDIISDIIDFSNKKNLFLLRKDRKAHVLYEYLDITEIDLEQFYFIFFSYWHSNCTSKRTNEMYKSHVIILKLMNSKNRIKNVNLLKILNKLPFIEIGSEFFMANKIYDDQNKLFKFNFENSLLPLEYRTNEWKQFLTTIGLKIKCDSKDCIKIANTLNRKYYANELNIDQVREFSMCLFDEIKNLAGDSNFLNEIKSIKFIPNYSFGKENEFHTKIYSPLANSFNKQNDLIYLKQSALIERKDFAWMVKPILPDYCQNSLEPLIYETLEINVENDSECTLENFKLILQKIKCEDFLKNLNKGEIKELFGILKRNFLEFEKSNLTHYLSSLECVLNRIPFTKQLQLSPIKTIFKEVIDRDQINGLIHKLPDELKECWKLFQSLGAKEKIDFDQCLYVLNYFYTESQSNNNQELTKSQFKIVTNIYKIMIVNNFLDQSLLNDNKLYAPNMNLQMMALDQLYYVDSSSCETLSKNSDQVKSLCIFEIKHLIKQLISSSGNTMTGNNNNNNTFSRLIFQSLQWKQIFQSFTYFKANPTHAAQPLSQIIVEKILDDFNDTKVVNFSITCELHSKEFAHAIVSAILILTDDHLDTADFNKENLIEDTFLMLNDLIVYDKEQINSCYFDVRINNKIENSQKETFIARRKKTTGYDFFIKKQMEDNLNLIEFYLAETIVEEIQEIILNKGYDFLNEIFKRKSHRLIYLISKLISNKNENSYETIINQFKLKSMFG